MAPDRAETIALWRYKLIAEASNPRLSKAERGQLVKELSARAHLDSDGAPASVSRTTLDRWIRAYNKDGLKALSPTPRSDTGAVRRNPELFNEAAALRTERPVRSAAAIADTLFARHGIRISERTLRDHLHSRGLTRAALTAEVRVFGRYEAERPNEHWIGDVLVGPFVPHPPRQRQQAGQALPAGRRPQSAPGPWPVVQRGEPVRRPARPACGHHAPRASRAALPGQRRRLFRRRGRPQLRRARHPPDPLQIVFPAGGGKQERLNRSNRTQAHFVRHSVVGGKGRVRPGLVGRARGAIHGDAKSDLHLPSGDAYILDEQTQQPLPLSEVELIDALPDAQRKVADASAESVLVGELVSLRLQNCSLLLELETSFYTSALRFLSSSKGRMPI